MNASQLSQDEKNRVKTYSVVFRQLSILTFYEKKSDVKSSLYLSMNLSESEACLNCFYNNNNAVMKINFDLFEAKGPLAVKLRKWGKEEGRGTDSFSKWSFSGIFCCMTADWDIGKNCLHLNTICSLLGVGGIRDLHVRPIPFCFIKYQERKGIC